MAKPKNDKNGVPGPNPSDQAKVEKAKENARRAAPADGYPDGSEASRKADEIKRRKGAE